MKLCERCHKSGAVVMSYFNSDMLCFKCKAEEKEDPKYQDARATEPSRRRGSGCLGIIFVFLLAMMGTTLLVQLLIAPYVLRAFAISPDSWNEVRGVIIFSVAIGITWLVNNSYKKRNKEDEEDTCPECHLLAPDHLDTCTLQHPDLR